MMRDPSTRLYRLRVDRMFDWNDFVPMHDLRYLFVLQEITHYILYNDPEDTLSRLITLYGDMNEMQVHVRVPAGRECLSENPRWSVVWNLEERLIRLAEKLTRGLTGPGGEEDTQQDKPSMIEKLQSIFAKAHAILKATTKTALIVSEEDKTSFRVAKCIVSKERITSHFPLNKLVATFVQEGLNNQITLQEMAGDHPEWFTTYFVEHPLRKQVLVSQISARMWRRNGMQFEYTTQVQRYSITSYESFYSELLLLQCAAALATPEHFYHMMKDRFELEGLLHFLPWEAEVPQEWERDQMICIIEHFFRLVIILITNRTLTGDQSEEAVIRHHLAHILFLNPATHSMLVENLVRDHAKNPHIKDILAEISTFDQRPMERGEPGQYIVNESVWKIFDPYFPHYPPSEFQKVQERYTQHKQQQGDGKQAPRMLPIPVPCATTASFSSLMDLLESKYLHRLLYWQLLYAAQPVRQEDILADGDLEPLSSDSTVQYALHLLYLAVVHCTADHPSRQAQPLSPPHDPHHIFRRPGELAMIYDDIIRNMTISFKIPEFREVEDSALTEYYEHSLLSILCQLHDTREDLREFITCIFDALKANSHGNMTLDTQLREYEERQQRQSKAAAEEDSEQSKAALRKAKQQSIMNAFKKKQASFMSAVSPSLMEDDDLEDDTPVCAVCKETCVPTLERPVGRVAYQQLSQTVQYHASQHGGPPIEYQAPPKPHPSLKSNLFREILSELTGPDAIPQNEIDQDLMDEVQAALHRQVDEEELENVDALELDGSEGDEETEEEEKEAESFPPSLVWKEMLRPSVSLDIQFCQHVIHASCFQKYFDTLRSAHNRRSPLDVDHGEFYCPFCRALSNVIVPIPPSDLLSLSEAPEDDQPYGESKDFFDTFMMNTTRVLNLGVPEFYTLFDIGHDINYISAVRTSLSSGQWSGTNEGMSSSVRTLRDWISVLVIVPLLPLSCWRKVDRWCRRCINRCKGIVDVV